MSLSVFPREPAASLDGAVDYVKVGAPETQKKNSKTSRCCAFGFLYFKRFILTGSFPEQVAVAAFLELHSIPRCQSKTGSEIERLRLRHRSFAVRLAPGLEDSGSNPFVGAVDHHQQPSST